MVLWLYVGLQVKTKGKAMFDQAMELDNKSALDSPHYKRVTYEGRILGARRSTGRQVGSAKSAD
jgi:hypothetical protein